MKPVEPMLGTWMVGRTRPGLAVLASALMLLAGGCRDDDSDPEADYGTGPGDDGGDTGGGPGGDTGAGPGGGPGDDGDTGAGPGDDGADTGDDGDAGDDGEPDDCEPGNSFITLDQMQSFMVADITALDAEDRIFTRYLTITNNYNAGECGAQLQLRRDMLNKLMNSLSLDPSVQEMIPIDPDETVFRIDLRDFDWENELNGFATKWEAVAAANPYAVTYDGDDAETLQTFSGSLVPFMTGESVLDTAGKPPLYYDIIEVPATLGQLEAQLGVDRQNNLDNGDAVRSGFMSSFDFGIARVLERHEIPLAAGRTYWVSWDISDGDLAQNSPFVDPLGFQPSGADVMFTLPNGMFGFALADQNEGVIDVAPVDLLRDEWQDDGQMVAGLSCFRCHANMIDHEDEIRDFVSGNPQFNADEQDDVETQYIEREEFTAFVTADNGVLGAAFAQVGLQQNATDEPVMGTFMEFREGVTLEIAAAELGIPPDALIVQLAGLNPTLQTLASGGTINRDAWSTLYPETVCLLEIGVTSACAIEEEQPGN